MTEESKPCETVTKERMISDLRAMGIKSGDALMVHSSLKSIGWVEGAADAVIDAFLDVLTDEGLIIVPTLTATFAGDSDQMSLHAFDPEETPSRVGRITDTLWRRRNAFRSSHPTHSIAAIGAGAEELVSGATMRTFQKEGPYGNYLKTGATIMFLGTNMGCNTTLHVAEDWAELPYMGQDCAVRIRNPDGTTRVGHTQMAPNGHRSFYAPDETSPIVQELYRRQLVRESKMGQARVRLIGAQQVINTMLELFYDDPAFLLCTKPDCEFCVNGRADCEREKPRIRETIEQLRDDGWCSF